MLDCLLAAGQICCKGGVTHSRALRHPEINTVFDKFRVLRPAAVRNNKKKAEEEEEGEERSKRQSDSVVKLDISI